MSSSSSTIHDMDYAQKGMRVDSWGELLASIKPIADLIEYRKELDRDLLTDEQRDERLKAKMDENGFSFRSALAEKLPMEADALPLAMLVHQAVEMLMQAKPDLTVGGALDWVNGKLSLDDMARAFITSRATGGADNSILHGMGGQVLPGVMGSKSENPVAYVVASATAKTDFEEHIAEYRRTCKEHFEGIPNPKAHVIEFVALCIRHRDSGLSNPRYKRKLKPSEIAQRIWADENPDYERMSHQVLRETCAQDYINLHNRVKQALTRDLDRVTRTHAPLSP